MHLYADVLTLMIISRPDSCMQLTQTVLCLWYDLMWMRMLKFYILQSSVIE
jgi:hypothetical protein